MRGRSFAEIKSNTADEAGINVALGRMAHQTRRLVDHQKVVVFGDDVEKMFHPLLQLMIGWLDAFLCAVKSIHRWFKFANVRHVGLLGNR